MFDARDPRAAWRSLRCPARRRCRGRRLRRVLQDSTAARRHLVSRAAKTSSSRTPKPNRATSRPHRAPGRIRACSCPTPPAVSKSRLRTNASPSMANPSSSFRPATAPSRHRRRSPDPRVHRSRGRPPATVQQCRVVRRASSACGAARTVARPTRRLQSPTLQPERAAPGRPLRSHLALHHDHGQLGRAAAWTTRRDENVAAFPSGLRAVLAGYRRRVRPPPALAVDDQPQRMARGRPRARRLALDRRHSADDRCTPVRPWAPPTTS